MLERVDYLVFVIGSGAIVLWGSLLSLLLA
jgi:hypothetical protein